MPLPVQSPVRSLGPPLGEKSMKICFPSSSMKPCEQRGPTGLTNEAERLHTLDDDEPTLDDGS